MRVLGTYLIKPIYYLVGTTTVSGTPLSRFRNSAASGPSGSSSGSPSSGSAIGSTIIYCFILVYYLSENFQVPRFDALFAVPSIDLFRKEVDVDDGPGG